jgi:hypothetical protein
MTKGEQEHANRAPQRDENAGTPSGDASAGDPSTTTGVETNFARMAAVHESANFEIVRYVPDHLRALRLQPMQAELRPVITAGDLAEQVARSGPAWTVLDGGQPVACAGFQFPWPGRAIAWAALGECGRRMARITRAVRQELMRCPAERIECHVKAGFGAGKRWAAALGFAQESLMPRFYGGEDFWCYVILKESHTCR